MDKMISIIVPAYNIEKYIEKCVYSIVNQSHKNIEIVIVDDGSTDETGNICDKLAKIDDRIKVIHQKNQGLSAARNNGIKAANGEYISLIDGDDVVEKGFLKNMSSTMCKGVDVVISGYKTVNENGDILSVIKNEKVVTSGKETTIRLLTQQEDFFVIAWNKLYRKSLFDENNIWYPAGRIHEDNLTTYKLLSKANRVAVIDSANYLYTKRAGSITNKSKKAQQIKEKINAAKDAMKYFADDGDLREAANYSLFLAQIIELNETIRGIISGSYPTMISRILAKGYSKNKYCSVKDRVYIAMLETFSGRPYIIFRKIVDKVL